MLNYNNDENGRRPIHWGGATIAFALVLLGAILMVYLVSTADFGDPAESTVPRTPGPCAPFCPATPVPR
ncbi:hypothetical protein F5X71_30115 [Nocardia brasiliensis]|uniref:Uncharacterized protein n=1 Tax=Nocardia brasiliensis TaxID=37326 RepID=A0A6G9Y407_NOCBR|nr:hypothetical protein F5X71_30115 [Nocardia brasiliensis]